MEWTSDWSSWNGWEWSQWDDWSQSDWNQSDWKRDAGGDSEGGSAARAGKGGAAEGVKGGAVLEGSAARAGKGAGGEKGTGAAQGSAEGSVAAEGGRGDGYRSKNDEIREKAAQIRDRREHAEEEAIARTLAETVQAQSRDLEATELLLHQAEDSLPGTAVSDFACSASGGCYFRGQMRPTGAEHMLPATWSLVEATTEMATMQP
ncbi:hypothetical protein AK812_SmicGene34952 [Symbiodinium microadriaticum]|uniref:Uncharacterized protein n=1 Tax=Symbiodinium microadriaticum TaxID=2951 RepID=A0A1Q9CMQ5_SYMMI|nr:hypothetical protein AK812_SmicGene34952 [Symbiodinium microadriaticum]